MTPRKPLRILSFLALTQVAMILLSSVGIAVDVHLCQDRVKSMGIFADAPVCNMEDAPAASCNDHTSQNEAQIDSRCCSNIHFFAQEDVDFSAVNYTVDLSVIEVQPVTSPIEVSRYCAADFPLHIPDPPPKATDLLLLYDVFLI